MGGLIFALSDDGRTFTGRHEDGEYWNGRRIIASTGGTGYPSSFSPRETLRTALAAANVLADENNLNARRFLDSPSGLRRRGGGRPGPAGPAG